MSLLHVWTPGRIFKVLNLLKKSKHVAIGKFAAPELTGTANW
jgi:hypothetical protein